MAQLSCSSLLSDNVVYEYLARGATSLVFEQGDSVFNVPFHPEASSYDLKTGYDVALHESHLFDVFSEILGKGRISFFRPIAYARAEKITDPEFELLVDKTLWRHGLIFRNPIERNGMMVSEKVEGRTLEEILQDPEIELYEKQALVERFNQAVGEMEQFLTKKRDSLMFPGEVSIINSSFENYWVGLNDEFQIHWLMFALDQFTSPVSQRTAIQVGSLPNVIVEADGSFVLIDPN